MELDRWWMSAAGTTRERFQKSASAGKTRSGYYYDGEGARKLVMLTEEEYAMDNNELLAKVKALMVLES